MLLECWAPLQPVSAGSSAPLTRHGSAPGARSENCSLKVRLWPGATLTMLRERRQASSLARHGCLAFAAAKLGGCIEPATSSNIWWMDAYDMSAGRTDKSSSMV